MTTEDRTAPRYPTEMRVRLKTHEEFISQYTQNISRGGLFIHTLNFLPVNTVVQLQLQLPDRRTEVSVIARVAHVIGPEEAAAQDRTVGMGLEFLDFETGGQMCLQDYFRTLRQAKPGGERADRRDERRILLVEDEGEMQREIGSLFLRHGLRLSIALTGQEALTKCLQSAPDLILSDIEMPTMDGWTLLRLVRAHRSLGAIPFVFLTGRESQTDRLTAYRLGADDFVPKSTPPARILARVRRVLENVQTDPQRVVRRNMLSGELRHVAAPRVLQLLESERRTGTLTVRHEDSRAVIHLREGRPMACGLDRGEQAGREALFTVFSWAEGRFEFVNQDYAGADEIQASLAELLSEARLRRR